MENLNDKVWYRFLKVVFIIAFIGYQVGVIYSTFPTVSVYRCNNGKIVPFSHNNYAINDVYDYRVNKECDPNVIVPTFDKD
ncbi:MAG: hypothetical protein NT094_02885 [Candidatus Staskawiczbacteria bacterium]|nr:hypothetical protein [Candidatus Staskawiczbacteria bacterium]